MYLSYPALYGTVTSRTVGASACCLVGSSCAQLDWLSSERTLQEGEARTSLCTLRVSCRLALIGGAAAVGAAVL